MADIRIINREAVPKCGSFEVSFADGRRPRSDLVASDVALKQAKAFA